LTTRPAALLLLLTTAAKTTGDSTQPASGPLLALSLLRAAGLAASLLLLTAAAKTTGDSTQPAPGPLLALALLSRSTPEAAATRLLTGWPLTTPRVFLTGQLRRWEPSQQTAAFFLTFVSLIRHGISTLLTTHSSRNPMCWGALQPVWRILTEEREIKYGLIPNVLGVSVPLEGGGGKLVNYAS
jgi:hypothetical protein